MDSNAAKERIQSLVVRYKTEADSGKLKKYTEEDIKKGFILPLFEALGWNTTERSEVSSEEHIKSSGRVDYGFYLNDRPKFYLEAKSTKANIHDEQWARQAIRYSWNKGVTWAVLTNFERLLIFNAQDIKSSLGNKLLFDISYTEYVSELDRLSLLSKELFASNALDVYAEKIGKKFQRVPISALLYKDLDECRTILTKALAAWNPEVKSDLLDEGVQKLLDRLIFIRVAEDRGVEPPTLLPLVRAWEASKNKNEVPIYASMVNKFREFDKIYNSNLFSEHPFERWEEYSEATEDAIKILYGKQGYYEYDFKAMPADVLGTVYENYLGHRLSKSKKGITLDKDAGKRKEQGIYYTPSFIVDYIVKHALKPILDKCTTAEELLKIKVLDPACGSGSFLIKALEVLNEKYKSLGSPGDERTKLLILTHNIFGVDLDEQAVEIARLNLLINSLDGKMKLPYLTDNIKCGNSLISGTETELKKTFGPNYREKKPFNWQEEFPDVFKQGGFDVIIGNPPYIKEFVSKSVFDGLHDSPYYQGKMDIWTMFGCIAIDLLKNGGILSFIAPNNWITNAGASIFRDKVLKDGELKTFIDFGDYKVFEQAGIQTMIFAFKKKKPSEKYSVDYLRIDDRNIAENQLITDIFGKKSKVDIQPKKFIGKNIAFAESKINLILEKIQSRKNFELIDDEISNGIHHHHDSVNKDRQKILGNNFSVGDGIFVLSDSEKNKIAFNKKELKIIKPSYTTREFGKWYGNPHNREWVIYTDSTFKNSDKINSYPNIKKHLDKFKEVITSDNKPYGLHRAKKEKFFIGEKIIALRKCAKPTFTYVNFDSYVSATFYIIKSERINQKYLAAILNSSLIAFWLRNKGKMQGNNYQLDKEPLIKIPIYVGKKEQQKQIIALVEKMLSLNQELQKVTENSNEWNSIKEEIAKTDRKIDEEVYKLYRLREEEIKIVEAI